MSGGRKILFVSVDVPSRTGSGSVVRSFHFLRGIARKNDVDLLIPQPISPADRNGLENLVRRLITPSVDLPDGKSIWSRIARSFLFPFSDRLLPLRECLGAVNASLECGKNRLPTILMLRLAKYGLEFLWSVGGILGLHPLSFSAFFYKGFDRCLRSLVEAGSGGLGGYDILWFEHTVSLECIQVLNKVVKADFVVCNSHNVEYLLAKQLANPVKASVCESSRIMATEAKCLRSVNLTLMCSEADKCEFRRLCPSAELLVAPNGVELAYFSTGDSRRHDGKTLLFTGSISYKPNFEGITSFLDRIFPLIKAKEPGVKLIIAGRSADLLQRAVSGDIEVVSDPEDMRVQFCRATVAVVPLKSGGGTRLKILEAMAMGVPVVSSTIGAEGVGYRSGVDLKIADSPEDFADTVVELLRDPAEQDRLSKAGREFVEKSFDWEAITSKAWDCIQERCSAGNLR